MGQPLAGVCVLFDLDGTLVDTAADLAAAMNHALEAAGAPQVAPADVRHLVGHGARAMLREGFARGGLAPDEAALNSYVDVFLDYYLAHIADNSRPFPGAVAAIEELRGAGARIAVCTNKREAPARALLSALSLDCLIDAIVGGDTAGAPKPDPAPVRLCLERTACKTGFFVGDSDTDIKAAEAGGMPCLLALFGYGPIDLSARAALQFEDFASLPEAIYKLAGRSP